jgi:phenylalanyl-tRNA synthetase beta chain
MRVSLNWLKDYIDISISAADLANRLMMSGNEVKAVEKLGGNWQNVVIAQITAVRKGRAYGGLWGSQSEFGR